MKELEKRISDLEKNRVILSDKLDEMAEKYGVSPTAVAAAWILRHPAKIQVIAGSVSPDRMVVR